MSRTPTPVRVGKQAKIAVIEFSSSESSDDSTKRTDGRRNASMLCESDTPSDSTPVKMIPVRHIGEISDNGEKDDRKRKDGTDEGEHTQQRVDDKEEEERMEQIKPTMEESIELSDQEVQVNQASQGGVGVDHPVPMVRRSASDSQPVTGVLETFSVFRSRKVFALLRSEDFRMLKDDIPVYLSRQRKDKISQYHAFSSCVDDSDIGIVRVYESGRSCALISLEKKRNDDREGEIAGWRVSGTGASICVVIPNDGIVWPISRYRSLDCVATRAMKGEPIEDHYRVLWGQPPSIVNGEVVIGDRAISAVESCKNVVVESESGDVIFGLVRMSDGCFNVRCRAPITPVVALGLAISVITVGV